MTHATFRTSLNAVFLLVLGSLPSLYAQDCIVWEKDINTAIAKARAANRLVFVHFYGENCPPCKLMESEVFPNRQVIADMNRFFVPVRVNAALNPQLVKQFNVDAIPADLVLKPDGQPVHRRQGGISAERFAVYLNYINEEAGAKNAVVPQEPTVPYQALETRQPYPPSPSLLQGPPPNPRNVAAEPPIADANIVGLVPPPVPVVQPSPVERNNPVRTGPPEVAAAPKSPIGSVVPSAETPLPLNDVPTVEIPLALDGFCPVTLSEERWQIGNPLYYGMYQGQIFRCVNEEALIAFSKDPAKYAPVAMGEDIVQMVNRNKKVPGQRKFGAWFKDRVYLFSSQESLDAFAAKPEFYAEIATKYETALRTRFDSVQR